VFSEYCTQILAFTMKTVVVHRINVKLSLLTATDVRPIYNGIVMGIEPRLLLGDSHCRGTACIVAEWVTYRYLISS